MLTIIYSVVVLFVSVVLFTWLIGVIVPNPRAGEIEVKLSPEESIKEMTVNEFRSLASDYLEHRGYSVDTTGESLSANRDDELFHVEFDFEGKASNPRTINGLMAEQKKRESDRLILFTLATVEGQAQKLADRFGIEVVDPETIIDWKRNRNEAETDTA